MSSAAIARPPTIDPVAAAHWQRVAPAVSPWLHEEVARRMQGRLQWIKTQPTAWAHWAPARGGLAAHRLLAACYPTAACFMVEEQPAHGRAALAAAAAPWWHARRWRAPAARLGCPPEGSVQLLWANMALHLAADPQALIGQWARALGTGGFLMFSCLGPDTVRELRALYAALGWPPPGHAFTDMHDWGDMLVHAGLAEPVMDMERLTLTYDSPARLLRELRELGRNLHPARFAGLRGRGWRMALERELAARLVGPDGRLALTFEIIYGHAFKSAPRAPLRGESMVPLQDMRAMLRGVQAIR